MAKVSFNNKLTKAAAIAAAVEGKIYFAKDSSNNPEGIVLNGKSYAEPNVIEDFNPDIIHLHNVHGYYLNIEVLFEYLKKSKRRVIWTLHDCWPFTGHCAYFDASGCNKWQSQCEKCNQINRYPDTKIDKTYKLFKEKKQLLTKKFDIKLALDSSVKEHWKIISKISINSIISLNFR